MATATQRFPLPNMPFRREIHNGCAIGTWITCTAQAFQAKQKSFTMQLSSAKDVAILVTVPIAKHGQITANARIHGKFTSEVEKPIFLPYQSKFTLQLRITQYVIEIFFNNNHMMDFVHRACPTDIKEVFIEGPLIVDEVVFTSPQGAMLDPVPSYAEATGSTSNPIAELQFLNLGTPPTPVVTPSPAPSALPVLKSTPGLPTIDLSSCVVNQATSGLSPAGAVIGKVPETSQNRSSSSASFSLEQNAHYIPQRAQSSPTSSTTSYVVTSSTTYLEQFSVQSLQPTQSLSTSAIQPHQTSSYPSSSQTSAPMPSYQSSSQPSVIPQQCFPGPMPQQAIPQLYGVPQQYSYPTAPNPYMQQQQYTPTATGMQVHPPYNPYHQVLPFQCSLPLGPYTQGYSPQYYGNYPIVYGPGCNSIRHFY